MSFPPGVSDEFGNLVGEHFTEFADLYAMNFSDPISPQTTKVKQVVEEPIGNEGTTNKERLNAMRAQRGLSPMTFPAPAAPMQPVEQSFGDRAIRGVGRALDLRNWPGMAQDAYQSEPGQYLAAALNPFGDSQRRLEIGKQAEAGLSGFVPTPFRTEGMRQNVEQRPVASAIGAALNPLEQAYQGGVNLRRGIDEGDTLRGAGGVAQGLLATVPYAPQAGGVIKAAGDALMKTAPRAAATVGTLGVTSQAADARDQAQAARKVTMSKTDQAIAEDPEVASLRSKIEDMRARETKARTEDKPGFRDRALADQRRKSDGDAIAKQITPLETQLRQAENRARAAFAATLPLRERSPEVASGLWMAGTGIAAGYGLAKGLAGRVAERSRNSKIANLTEEVDAGMTGKTSAATVGVKRDQLERHIAASQKSTIPSTLGTSATGAGLTIETSALPEQLDIMLNPSDHPASIAAKQNQLSPTYWSERGITGITGAGAAMLGKKIGQGLGAPFTKSSAVDMPRAEEVLARGVEPNAIAKFFGAKAGGQESIDNVKRYRDMIEDAKKPRGGQGTLLPPPGPSKAGDTGAGSSAPPPVERGNGPGSGGTRSGPQKARTSTGYADDPRNAQSLRPHIENLIRSGQPLPLADEVNAFLKQAGLSPVARRNDIEDRLDNTASILAGLKKTGRSSDEQADALRVIMENPGKMKLLSAAGPAVGLSLPDNSFMDNSEKTSNQADPPKHHSHVQPRTKGGQFNGPPTSR